MFSRKKNEPLFEIIDEERRSYFRIKSSREEPIYVFLGSDRYHVKDIGAGGIGIYMGINDKRLEIGKEYPFNMFLKLINQEVSGILRVVDISDREYHSVFIDLDEDEIENIHLFALERQKEELREKASFRKKW
ncbi:MAG: PilZ domain-containing protein [Thermodesulfobacteriota bacterium]|nr:PilZ domain-containing protein [Thermodesulfobacteriota bacterium]